MTKGVSSGEPGPGKRLDSWKEIAGYLGRSVRTVQRWEKEEGLPVYRREAVDSPGGAQNQRQVFAYEGEIDHWWRSFVADASRSAPSGADAADSEPEPRAANPRSYSPRLIALVAAILVAAVIWRLESRSPEAAAVQPSAPAQTVLEKIRDMPYPLYSISPDGKRLAYREEPQRDLWVEPMDGGAGRIRLARGFRGSGMVWSADSTRLVFSYVLPDRTCAIRIFDVGTEQARDLWSGECRDPERPNPMAWHPRQPALLCRVDLPNRRWQLLMLDVDSGERTNLFEVNAPLFGQDFSPDGRMLAYSATIDGNTDIYVRSLSGGEPIRVTTHPERDRAPVWTTSDALLFLSQRGGPAYDLWATQLTWLGQTERSPILVSPVGLLQASGLSLRLLPDESVLFHRDAPATQAVLLPVHPATGASTTEPAQELNIGTERPHYLDGGRTLRFYGTGREWVDRDLPSGTERVAPLPEVDGQVWIPVFAGQERPLAFYGADSQGRRGFHQVIGDTSEVRLIRRFEDPVNPPLTWSPDNREILFEQRRSKAHILAISADGETLREIATSESRAFQRWSPDGSRVAFTDSGCLMTVAREGGPVRRIVCSNDAPPPPMSGAERANLGEIAWKPTGEQLAWTAYHPDRRAVDIWVVDRETGAHHVVWTGESGLRSWPSELEWSPDSSSIAFTKRFQRRWEIWRLKNFLPLEGSL